MSYERILNYPPQAGDAVYVAGEGSALRELPCRFCNEATGPGSFVVDRGLNLPEPRHPYCAKGLGLLHVSTTSRNGLVTYVAAFRGGVSLLDIEAAFVRNWADHHPRVYSLYKDADVTLVRVIRTSTADG